MKRFTAILIVLNLIFNLLPVYGADMSTLVYNENFDGDFTNIPSDWSYFSYGSAESIEKSTTLYTNGNGSLHINATDYPINDKLTPPMVFNGGVSGPFIKINPEKGYVLKINVYNITSKKISVFLKYYDKNKNQLTSNSTSGAYVGKWEEMRITKNAPQDAVYCRVQIVSNSGMAGEGYFDDLRIYENGGYSSERYEYIPPVQSESVDARIVQPTENGLKYNIYTDKGDKLGDYSYAGFYAGEYKLPDSARLPLYETIYPSEDENNDDTTRIQEIIDNASTNTPIGKMSVVKLKAGKYNINKNGLYIRTGVVLSGEGQGPDGTIIYAYEEVPESESRHAIKIFGSSSETLSEKYYITNDYVPAGSNKITVTDASGFKPGDLIRITQPANDDWYAAIEMSDLKETYAITHNNINSSWSVANSSDRTAPEVERTVSEIIGNALVLDFPLNLQYFKEYPAYVQIIKKHSRVENAGIENLRIQSYYDGSLTDEDHTDNGISMQYAQNCYVKDVTFKHFIMAAVSCGKKTKQITIQNCSSITPISRIEGSRRYPFHCSNGAQQILFTGCYSEDGRHDYAGSGRNTGPIVYSDSVADNSNASSENHTWFGTGILFDNLYFISNDSNGFISFGNRGYYGSAYSHGWSSANCVSWNCLASAIVAHKLPLTYQNFSVGIWGLYTDSYASIKKIKNLESQKGIYRTNSVTTATDKEYATNVNTSMIGDSYKESESAPVNPESLFKAQLAERFSKDFKKAVPGSPIILSPYADGVIPDNTAVITGIFKLGAEKVKIYIDNTPYEAELDREDNTFKLTKTLEDGTHKVYATQVVNGIESSKTAERFISMNSASGYSAVNSSGYENTELIYDDTRLRYDEYVNQDEIIPETLGNEYFVYVGKDSGKEKMMIKNHLYQTTFISEPFATIYTKIPEIKGHKIKQCGIIISKSDSDFSLSDSVLKVENKMQTLKKNAFGVLIYGSIKKDVEYYFRSYGIYEKDGVELTLYGDIESFKL